MLKSKYNPLLSMELLKNAHENNYFDVKSARINPSKLYSLISAFANAEGGMIIIGVTDSTRFFEGINSCGENKINEFINAPKSGCRPMPMFDIEFLDITNDNGEKDRLLVLHIHASVDQIIRTADDSVYFRLGDQTREFRGDDLRNLEYSKSTRHYEDELNMDATIEDLDVELIEQYKNILSAETLSTEQVLKARGFLKQKNGETYLTNAAVLLFAENISRFYPNCRIRFIRYAGTSAQVGANMNIVKDVNIEYPILRIIEKAKEFISTQLRDFTALNIETGKFQTVPEYPEFAWLEGIVNAVTHREYAMSGRYISVKMFDDRLEIESPGKLPNLVTVKNIRDTRYSRNPRIARVLTDFGWVRELNEGVQRIYVDMKGLFLEDPEYSEPEQSVKLVLKNNVLVRTLRQNENLKVNIDGIVWKDLDKLSKNILAFMSSRKKVSRSDLEKYTGKSAGTITSRLNRLIELSIIERNSLPNDPKQTYSLKQ